MASKIHDYLFYAGNTKEEFRKVYPRLVLENYKIWKVFSALLAFLATICVVLCLTVERKMGSMIEQRYRFHLIFFIVVAVLYLLISILLNAVLKPRKSKAMSTVIYMTGIITMVGSVIFAVIDINYSPLLCAVFAINGFIYLDRPLKNLTMLASGLVIYVPGVIALFATGFYVNKANIPVASIYTSAVSVILIWVLGVVISSFVNFRRIQSRTEMIRIEKIGSTDALTEVFNKNKYDDKVAKIQKELAVKDVEFAVVVFDVNRLKETNDTYGHSSGDALLIRTVGIIKEVFQKSDIYRIGGDEFCCILTGEDYEHRAFLINNFHNLVESIHKNATSLQRDTSVASGLATFDPGADSDYMMVFARADKNMYRNKEQLKADDKFSSKNSEDVPD